MYPGTQAAMMMGQTPANTAASQIPHGTLSIQVVEAKNLKDKDLFGKQDPYVVLRVPPVKKRGKTVTDGGKNPNFGGESFEFTLTPNAHTLYLDLYDDDIGKDDVIGTATIPLANVVRAGYQEKWVPLSHGGKGKTRGEVRMIMSFMPQAGQNAPTAMAAPMAPGYTYGSAPPMQPQPAPYPPPMQHQQYPPQQQYGAPPPQQQYGAPPPQQQQYAQYPPPQQQQYAQYPPPQQQYPPQQQHQYPPQHGYAAPPPPQGYPPQQPGGYPPPMQGQYPPQPQHYQQQAPPPNPAYPYPPRS